MNHALGFIGGGGFAEEHQVAGFELGEGFAGRFDQFALVHLLRGIARQLLPVEQVNGFGKTAAIHALYRRSAPQIGNAHQAFRRVDQGLFRRFGRRLPAIKPLGFPFGDITRPAIGIPNLIILPVFSEQHQRVAGHNVGYGLGSFARFAVDKPKRPRINDFFGRLPLFKIGFRHQLDGARICPGNVLVRRLHLVPALAPWRRTVIPDFQRHSEQGLRGQFSGIAGVGAQIGHGNVDNGVGLFAQNRRRQQLNLIDNRHIRCF